MKLCDCTNLNKFLEDFPRLHGVIVLDCETTGLNPYHDEILQLSIISAHSKRIFYDGFFKPKIKKWNDAEKINHISPEMVKNKPSFPQERETIQKIIDGSEVIIGYNTGFDIAFLENSGIKFNKPQFVIDVMEDYAAFNGEFHSYFNTYTWKKLSYATKKTGYDWGNDPEHNSLSDCFATLFIAKYLQDQNLSHDWKPFYPPYYGIAGYDPNFDE